MNAVELDAVSKRFGERPVLDGITLSIAQSERIVVTGPSGCGKTTLLRIIAGLEVPDAGNVHLRGVRVAQPRRNLIEPEARGLGFVFQYLGLWPHMTVAEHLTFALRYGHRPEARREERAQHWLEVVQLGSYAHAKPSALSGGQQQRLALARALVSEPSIVLMDEPLSNLDSVLKAHLQSEILQLHDALRFTLLYVTHDIQEAAIIGTRSVALHAGVVLQA